MPVDYMKFLAVSTMTRRLAPHSEWRTAMSSPWLVNFEKNSGVFSLVDPYHNDKYHVRVPKSFENVQLCYCKDGWLLMCQLSTTTNPEDRYQPRLIFFNPFTEETIIYPTFPFLKFYLSQFGFSSSPSSSNCAVVAVSWSNFFKVGIYTSRSREEEWRYFVVQVNIPIFPLDFMSYPIFVDGAFYFMSKEGRLGVLRTEGSDDNDGFSWEILETTPCKFWRSRNFLVECDGELLFVFVAHCDERRVEVFKLNSNTLVWERVHSLGNRTLYISHSSALSAEAKIPKMEEKIYLPRFYEQAIVSYSLATGLYHYSSGSEEGSLEDYYGTRHQPFSGWIVPRWL
ncbi:hypothetical protein Vadar_020980 [Vaccinium darrowii]|uniref:Uncharacterized protein n=1 Tax=Vaccinium darrowii TaxID=229202 RepID=A0ACB7Z6S5_9ERIC|nr:hypothetical protein Vadar_020980 [Vaccinium darrowii]